MKLRAGVFAALMAFAIPMTLLGQSSPGAQGVEGGLAPGMYAIPGSHLLQKESDKVAAYVQEHPESVSRPSLQKPSWSFAIGSTQTWKAYDYVKQSYYDVASTCRGVGTHCYIFVQDSLWETRVPQAAVDSVMQAFDDHTSADAYKGVYQTDVETFGPPPDIDGDPRIVILILNIQDGFSGSGGFVAGYFWGGNEVRNYPNGNNAEIYYVDANPLNLTRSWGVTTAMSTAAHEFQHMIHFGKDNQEVSFINEGCSCYAETNCGYDINDQSGYINETNHYLLDWRTVSDPNVLNDYSRASRFFQYIGDQFGAGVFAPIVASALHGISGLDAGLASYAADRRFAQIFPDWLVANILDDRTVNLDYGYIYPALPKAASTTYADPTVSLTQGTVAKLGAEYLSYTAGYDLRITFTTSNSSLVVKAVEIGSPSRVLTVTPGVEFREPGFGSTYPTIHFVVINTSQAASASFSYQSTGGGSYSDVSDPAASLPLATQLAQNYPNPFNPKTVVSSQLAVVSNVRIVIYDLLGREVATLVNARRGPGIYHDTFDATGLASGVYVCRLTAGAFVQSKTMVLLK
jgi:hypothetical protein